MYFVKSLGRVLGVMSQLIQSYRTVIELLIIAYCPVSCLYDISAVLNISLVLSLFMNQNNIVI